MSDNNYTPDDEINADAAQLMFAFHTGMEKSEETVQKEWLSLLNKHIIPEYLELKTSLPVTEFEIRLNDLINWLPVEVEALDASIRIARYKEDNRDATQLIIFNSNGDIAQINVTQLNSVYTNKQIWIEPRLRAEFAYQMLVSASILAVRLFLHEK